MNSEAFILLLIMTVLTVFIEVCCESVHRRGATRALTWAFKNFLFFVFNFVLYGSMMVLFLTLSGGLLPGFIICFLIPFLLASVSYFKFAARNDPMYASDFLLMFKVMGVADSDNIVITRQMVLAFVGAVFMSVILFFVKIPKPMFVFKIIPVLVACGLLVFIPMQYSKKSELDFSYRTSGFLLGLLINIIHFLVKNPAPESNEENLQKHIKSLSVKTEISGINGSAFKPNVIIILSESFWDLTRIENLKLSEDPTPNFRKIYKNCDHGNIVVTPFGGGTCNVEAEVLLGICTRHFNISSSFYHSRFLKSKEKIKSLASFFNSLGYSSHGVHTFNKTFYDRDKALSKMGFMGFTGIEDIENVRLCGKYAADSLLSDVIINQYEKTDAPKFIFGISMENHQPYGKGKYGDKEKSNVKVLNDGLNSKLKTVAENYATGINHADKELGRLVDYFSNRKEPVALLFFGDHLGALGPELELYRKMGYVDTAENLVPEDLLKIYSTPFLIWSNFKKSNTEHGSISPNFLGNILMDYLGLVEQKPELYKLLSVLSEKMKCISRSDVFIDSNNKIHSRMPDDFRELEKIYIAYEHKLQDSDW